MTGDSLNSGRNPTLRLIHSRSSLPSCPLCSLLVQAVLLSIIIGRHLSLLMAHAAGRITRCRIRWRSSLLWCTVHVSIGWRWLSVSLLRVLIHLHRICRCCSRLLLSCLRLRLRGLGSSLLAKSFRLLLLLNTRWWRLARRVLQVHWRYKRLRKFLLCDKWMELRLLRCPPFQGVDI